MLGWLPQLSWVKNSRRLARCLRQRRHELDKDSGHVGRDHGWGAWGGRQSSSSSSDLRGADHGSVSGNANATEAQGGDEPLLLVDGGGGAVWCLLRLRWEFFFSPFIIFSQEFMVPWAEAEGNRVSG
jgi:hypothetical protein